jgi:hypothetical protein
VELAAPESSTQLKKTIMDFHLLKGLSPIKRILKLAENDENV